MAGFPDAQPGVRYLAEGGQETELMYKHGHELPEFAMYPLLDDPGPLRISRTCTPATSRLPLRTGSSR
jgi:homocysteine S-methyltransferase